MIADGVTPARAALALLAAGHRDAAADVLAAAARMPAATVDLVRMPGNALAVRVREVTR